MATRKRPGQVLYQPQAGEVVRDLARKGALGQYMATHAGSVFLRPVGGGMEWETHPHEIEPVPPEDPSDSSHNAPPPAG